jgi:hypothetical protein
MYTKTGNYTYLVSYNYYEVLGKSSRVLKEKEKLKVD